MEWKLLLIISNQTFIFFTKKKWKKKNLKENLDIERRWHLQLARRIKQLEEEIKTLKECNKSQSEVINNVFIPQRERLEEENKKLNEKVRFLEECLDRKEKLNGRYRKELDKSTYVYDAKQVRDIC